MKKKKQNDIGVKYIDILFNDDSVRLYEADEFKPIITDDLLNWSNDNRVETDEGLSYLCLYRSNGVPVIASRGNPYITLEQYTTPKTLNSSIDDIINFYCEG